MSLDFRLMCGEASCFDTNITHNLGEMAGALGVYKCLWRPEENGIKNARDAIAPLERAVKELGENMPVYKRYDSPNGWGEAEDFFPWLHEVLAACKASPDATIEVSR